MESTLQALMPNCLGKKFQFGISHQFLAAGLPARFAGIRDRLRRQAPLHKVDGTLLALAFGGLTNTNIVSVRFPSLFLPPLFPRYFFYCAHTSPIFGPEGACMCPISLR